MGKNRGNFSSRFAVVMALAGSAIGLGNIWRFPYMVGQHGGAAFIIIYVLCSLFVALPVFFAESLIGKDTGSDTFGALARLAPKGHWKDAGYMSIITSFIILCFYSVVGGWSLDYLIRALGGGFSGMGLGEASGVFAQMSSSAWESVGCAVAFLVMTAAIVAAGIEKGIGGFSKVMMPLLFLMVILIVIRSVSLPGAKAGIDYMLKPDFSKIDGPAIAGALGQSFFSLSLGVGAVLTYSSYMRKEENILYTGLWTALFDTLFAILAGFAIMPAVFAAGLEPGSGPSLVYETLPVIFSEMGTIVPVIFFLAVLIAALTSSISMLEVCVAFLVDQKGLKRGKATAAVFACALILATACAISTKVFDTCNFVTSNVLMMIGAFVFALVAGWKMTATDFRTQFTNYGTSKGARAFYPLVRALIRWVAPVAIIAIAVTNLL